MAEPRVVLDLGRLHKLRDFIRRRSNAARKVILEWSKLYSGFIQERFVRFSRGGGNWPPIKPGTAARKGHDDILVDTLLMYEQLDPTIQGFHNVQQGSGPFQATVTFGGNAHYPDGTSVQTVMGYHQTGAGNLPVRRILVPPDNATKKEMGDVAKKAMLEHAEF